MATQGLAVADSLTELAPALTPALWRRVLLRFAIAYWLVWTIGNFDVPLPGLKEVRPVTIDPVWNAMIGWAGAHVFGLTNVDFTPSGSGDRTIDWVAQFCIVCGAVIATIAWTVIARVRDARRCPDAATIAAHDDRLRGWLRIFLRYQLALWMLIYGVIKPLDGQFPPLDVATLNEHLGDSSPMGLLWTFMGASRAYVTFAGAAGLLGAGLLLFRRTATLGALVLAGVLTNVVMLNLCYDVPVKLLSSHCLAMSVYLIAPDARRLVTALWLGRATRATPLRDPLTKRWMRIARWILKWGLVAGTLYGAAQPLIAGGMKPSKPTPWIDSAWAVTRFVRDGHEVLPQVRDRTRWRRLWFYSSHDKLHAGWEDGAAALVAGYVVTVDESHQTLHLALGEDAGKAASQDRAHPQPAPAIDFRFVRADAFHLVLDGALDGAALHVELEQPDTSHSLVLERGFHWVNDEPFAR